MSMSVETIEALLLRFEAALAAVRPAYLDELAPGLTPAEWAHFEQRTGLELPDSYRRFVQWRDGQARDYDERLWYSRSLMDADLILETQRAWNELDALGQFDRPNWWHPMWVPFATDGCGNDYVLDLAGCFGGTPGQIVEVWHDNEDRHIYWASFEKWLETLVMAYEAGYRNLDYEQAEIDAIHADEAIFERSYAEVNPGYPMLTTADDPRGSEIRLPTR
jgi:cell wall assembly regulator SMI1